MMQQPVSVVCVLRRGGEYTAEHARRLYRGVRRWWSGAQSLRFVALTDDDALLRDAVREGAASGIEVRRLQYTWPKWWAKMELFTAAQDDLGDILYFDLDTMIVGYLDNIAVPCQSPVLLSDFYHPERVQSGMMWLPQAARPLVCASWRDRTREVMRQFRGDGEFLDSLWRLTAWRWQDECPGKVVSYKVHVRPTGYVPNGARVICFHGRPRPWETPLW